MESFVFEKYNSKDYKPIIDLFQKAFKRDLDLKVWNWIMRVKDKERQAAIWVALDQTNNKVIANYNLLPMLYIYKGKIINGAMCLDVMTDPSYQKKGVFVNIGKQALGNEKIGGRKIAIGIPNNNALPGHLKIGWKIAFNITLLEKKIDSHHCNFDNSKIKQIYKFDDRVNELFKFFSREYDFIMLRDKDYLNWRFFERPDVQYEIYAYENDKQLNGYIVFKIYNNEKFHIIELVYENNISRDELLKFAEYKANRFGNLSCWSVKDTPLYNKLISGEYRVIKDDIPFIIHELEEGFIKDSIKCPYIVMGDHDAF